MESLTLCPGEFRKAQRSSGGSNDCVECVRKEGLVFLRDDKVAFGSDADGILVFTEQQFDEYQDGVRAGITTGLCVDAQLRADGMYVFRNGVDTTDTTELVFTHPEVVAWHDGINNHEFDSFGEHIAHTAECTEAHRQVALTA